MKSYLRFLWKQKSLTVIQIVGISIALSFAIPAVSLLIELYQLNHDNPRYKDIYGVCIAGASSFAGEGDYFVDNYPEVEAATMFISSGTNMQSDLFYNNVSHKARTMMCNPDIMDFFPLKMASGTIECLSEGGSIILSKEFADIISDKDIVGSTVYVEDKAYIVRGILDEFKSRKIPQTDIVLSMDDNMDDENAFWTYTFLRLKEGTDIESFTQKVKLNDTDVFAAKRKVNKEKVNIRFDRYDDLSRTKDFYWLTSLTPGLVTVVEIALLILFALAFSNYINLSIAMATRRSKEIATKRLLGSSRADVWRQILFENVVFTAVCFAVGLLFASFSVKLLSGIIHLDMPNTDLLTSLSFTPVALISYVFLVIVIAVLTGLAPARAVSSYSALDVVKGEFRASEKRLFSKFLIVVQGAITVAILFVTIVNWVQLNRNRKMDFGCEIDDVYYVLLSSSDDDEKDLVMQTLSGKQYVSSIGFADAIPGFVYNSSVVEDMYVNKLTCDKDAFEAFGFRMREDYISRGESTLFMSEALRDELEGAEVGSELMASLKVDVVGGLIDPFLPSMHVDSGIPIVAVKEKLSPSEREYIILRTAGEHSEIAKDILQTVNKVVYDHSGRVKPSRCDYVRDFFNSTYLQKYESLLDMMKNYIVIMLVLSLLGILGVSTYNMQIRKHDIAIRKVFGSSTTLETLRNTKSYALLMLIANAAGLPVGYILASRFLESEVTKIDIAPWMFILTLLITMTAVVCMCMIQSYFAASVNPVDNLKSE